MVLQNVVAQSDMARQQFVEGLTAEAQANAAKQNNAVFGTLTAIQQNAQYTAAVLYQSRMVNRDIVQQAVLNNYVTPSIAANLPYAPFGAATQNTVTVVSSGGGAGAIQPARSSTTTVVAGGGGAAGGLRGGSSTTAVVGAGAGVGGGSSSSAVVSAQSGPPSRVIAFAPPPPSAASSAFAAFQPVGGSRGGAQ